VSEERCRVADGSRRHEAEIEQLENAAGVIIAGDFAGGGKRLRLHLQKKRVNKGPAVSEQHIDTDSGKDLIRGNPAAA